MTLQRAVRVPYVEVGLRGKKPDDRTGVNWTLWPFDVAVEVDDGHRAALSSSSSRACAAACSGTWGPSATTSRQIGALSSLSLLVSKTKTFV
jgi:hypothetical protein